MILEFQIYQIFDRIIKKLRGTITAKGTNNKPFQEYHPIFNSLHHSDKRFLIHQILLSRGRLIKYAIDNKQDVHMEGLGTFKYDENREEFYTRLHKKCEELGYEKVNDLPKDLHYELIDDVNDSLNEKRLTEYYNRLKRNRAKRFKPKALSVIIGKSFK